MSKHILVLGATGLTGIAFCNSALKAGNQLTVYARNPSKLPAEIKDHGKVAIEQGQLDDQASLKKAVDGGATVFVSFAGPVMSSPKGTPVTDCMKILFSLLIAAHYERALVLGTCSWTAPEDLGALKWKASVLLIKTIANFAYQEFNGLGAFVASTSVEDLKWTLFRVPFLGNGEAKPVTATYTGTGLDGFFLSRKSIAEWVLKEIKDGEWIGQAPILCN